MICRAALSQHPKCQNPRLLPGNDTQRSDSVSFDFVLRVSCVFSVAFFKRLIKVATLGSHFRYSRYKLLFFLFVCLFVFCSAAGQVPHTCSSHALSTLCLLLTRPNSDSEFFFIHFLSQISQNHAFRNIQYAVNNTPSL